MSAVETIVVPLDGSPLAESAIPYAAYLARATGASLVLLRVLETGRPLYDAQTRQILWLSPDNPRLDLMSPEILQPEVERLAAEGLTARPVVRLGDPRQEIIAEADQHPGALILLLSHGRGGLSRVLLGSVATRVLQMATCPVLILRAREEGTATPEIPFARIGVLLDGSELAERALPLAIELARATGATLELVRVAETFRDELNPEASLPLLTPSLEEILKHFDELEAEARDYLDAVAERLTGEGLSVTTRVYSGDPWRETTRYASEERPGLIVMTTHGRGGLARWFYGSVADKLLTTSEVPLLLVRAGT